MQQSWSPIPISHTIALGTCMAYSDDLKSPVRIHMGQDLYIFEVDRTMNCCRGYVLIPPKELHAFTQAVLSFNKEQVSATVNFASRKTPSANAIDISMAGCTECAMSFCMVRQLPGPSALDLTSNITRTQLDSSISRHNLFTKSFVPLANLKPLATRVLIVILPLDLVLPALSTELDITPRYEPVHKDPPPSIPHLQIWNQASNDTDYVLTKEIAAVIRIWCNTWLYYLFANSEYSGMELLLDRLNKLQFIRTQLEFNLLTRNEAASAKSRAVLHIGKINKAFGADIIARDSATGRPLCNDIDLGKAAQEQLSASLARLEANAQEDANLSTVYPTGLFHVYMDVSYVQGSLNPEFDYTMYFVIRSGFSGNDFDFPLTESFRVDINSESINTQLQELKAAMFRRISVSAVMHNRVYLTANLYKTSKANGICEGVAAGAADLTIFIKDPSPVTCRHVTLYMFANVKGYQGWGKLVRHILKGEAQGIVAAKEVESVNCSIKLFESQYVDNLQLWKSFVRNESVFPVRSYFLTCKTSGNVRDSIYLALSDLSVKVGDCELAKVWIQLTSEFKTVLFSKAANDRKSSQWTSCAVQNCQSIGQIVRISTQHSKDLQLILQEKILFHIYSEGKLITTLRHHLFNDNVLTTGKKVFESSSARLQIYVNYVGTEWNHQADVNTLFSWEALRAANQEMDLEVLWATLHALQDCQAAEFAGQFNRIVYILFNQLSYYSLKEDSLPYLCQRIYDTIICVLNRAPELLEPHLQYFFKTFTMGTVWKPILRLTMALMSRTKTQGTPDLLEFVKACPLLMRIVLLSAASDLKNGKMLPTDVMVNILECVFQCAKDFGEIMAMKEKHMIEIQLIVSGNIATCLDFFHGINEHGFIFRAAREVIGNARTDHNEIQTGILLELRKIVRDYKSLTSSGFSDDLIYLIIKHTHDLWKPIKRNPGSKQTQLRIICAIIVDQYNLIWPKRDMCVMNCHDLAKALYPLVAKIYVTLLRRFRSLPKEKKVKYKLTLLFSPPYTEIPIDSLISGRIFDETLIELGIVLCILSNYLTFILSKNLTLGLNPKQSINFCKLQLEISLSILGYETHLRDWLSLSAYLHRMIIQSLTYIGAVLIKFLKQSPSGVSIEKNSFDYRVWQMYLDCTMKLVCSKLLAFENLSEVDRATVWTICGNMRQDAIQLLLAAWSALANANMSGSSNSNSSKNVGGCQFMFCEDRVLIENIADMCLVSNEIVQDFAVDVLFEIALLNWELPSAEGTADAQYPGNQQIAKFQGQLIVAFSAVFDRRQIMPVTVDRNYFKYKLESLIRNRLSNDSACQAALSKMAEEIVEFVDLLLDLKWIPPSETYDDLRTFHSLNVFDFLKKNGNVDIFARYVYALALSNQHRRNYSQAATAYGILANLLKQDELLKQHPILKRVDGVDKSEYEIWDALSHLMIHLYRQDKAYEMAITVTKKLMLVYETATFNFCQLETHSRLLSELYEEVLENERMLPKYFRVSFLGSGFPRLLQGHNYIFEGLPWDRVEAVNRLLELFPGAQIVSNEAEGTGDMQYLYVCEVSPMRNEANVLLSSQATVRQLDTFFYLRPLPRTGDSSLLNTWVEMTIYSTYQPFPTIVRFSGVKSTEVKVLSPIGNALLALSDNITKMRYLIFRADSRNSTQSRRNLSTNLEVVLSNAILSPVNGGVQLYRPFLDRNEFRATPELCGEVDKLRESLIIYAKCIQKCLAIFQDTIEDFRMAYFERLQRGFHENYGPELEVIRRQDKSTRSSTSTMNSDSGETYDSRKNYSPRKSLSRKYSKRRTSKK